MFQDERIVKEGGKKKHMKLRYLFINIILMYCILGCGNKNHEPIFNTIKEIENSWTKEQVQLFKNLSDSSSSKDHFRYVLNFKNSKLMDSTLVEYFYSRDVYHIDDISYIVLTTLNRKLNKKPLKIEEQFQSVYDNQNENRVLEGRNLKRASKYYNKYKKGDTILIRMPIEYNNAILYGNPESNEWTHNDNFDMLIKGIIKDKRNNEHYGKQFKVKVLYLNKTNIKILNTEVKIYDEIIVELEENIIEEV